MKKSVKLNGFLLVIFTVATILIYNCGSDTTTNSTTGPAAGTISGTITFADTNRVQCALCGYYSISAFATWPPVGPPNGTDSLKLTKSNNTYSATYNIVGLTGGGNYVLVTAYTKLPYSDSTNYILGIHGCDTSSSCWFSSPKRDTIPSAQGLANINFLSWADTAKGYKF